MISERICCDELKINEYEYTLHYFDLNENEVKNTPMTNPYDFDEYVEWKGNYNKLDSAVYSDRLYQYNIEKYNKCYEETYTKSGKMFNSKNSIEINQFLNMCLGYDVELTAVVRGCNKNSGFPYRIFFYRKLDNKNKDVAQIKQ